MTRDTLHTDCMQHQNFHLQEYFKPNIQSICPSLVSFVHWKKDPMTRHLGLVILSTIPRLYLADQLLCTWLTEPSVIPFQSGTMAPERDHNQSNAFITAIFLFFSQPRLTAGCEKKVCARCANWKTEQQLIVMSSGKNSRMNKMQDIPTWPESREAQTFPVYFWIVLFIGRLFTEFFARLMSHL